MAENSRTIQVPVNGLFTSRPANDPKAEWKEAASTPGPVSFQPEQVYQFQFMGIPDVRDRDLEQLVDALRGVTALKSLDISGCEISSRAFQRVAELPWLESLTFYQLQDKGFETVAKLSELQKLNIESSPVTDRGLEQLSKLVKLKDLSLRSCPIGDRGVEHVAGLLELEEISLSGCRAITDRSIEVLAALPKLHILDLVGCWRLTDRGIQRIASMPGLKYVGLCRSSRFFERIKKRLGLSGNAEVGMFSAGAVEQLQKQHPNCDLWQPIDWDAISN